MNLIRFAAIILWLAVAQASAIAAANADLDDPEVIKRILNSIAEMKPKEAKAVYVDLISETKAKGFDELRKETCLSLFRLVYKDIHKVAVAELFNDCSEDQRQILLGLVDREPFPIYKATPLFDPRAANLRGLVCAVAEYAISPQGKPKSIKIIQTTHEALKGPVMRAVKKSRYAPAIKDGLKTKTPRYRVEYLFMIKAHEEISGGSNVSMVVMELGTDGKGIKCITD